MTGAFRFVREALVDEMRQIALFGSQAEDPQDFRNPKGLVQDLLVSTADTARSALQLDARLAIRAELYPPRGRRLWFLLFIAADVRHDHADQERQSQQHDQATYQG